MEEQNRDSIVFYQCEDTEESGRIAEVHLGNKNVSTLAIVLKDGTPMLAFTPLDGQFNECLSVSELKEELDNPNRDFVQLFFHDDEAIRIVIRQLQFLIERKNHEYHP
jgi:hypothetical protein